MIYVGSLYPSSSAIDPIIYDKFGAHGLPVFFIPTLVLQNTAVILLVGGHGNQHKGLRRMRAASGYSISDLADMFVVSSRTIYQTLEWLEAKAGT